VPRKVASKQDGQAKSGKAATTHEQQPAPSSPAVDSQHADNAQKHGQSKTSETEQKNFTVAISPVPQVSIKKSPADYVCIGASILVALATLILAITARIQAKAANASAESAKSQAAASVEAASAASDNAATAKANTAALENIERAWLIADRFPEMLSQKLFVLTMLLAVMQAAPPVPRKTADNPTKTSSYVKNHSGSDQKPSAQPRPLVQPNESPASKRDTNQQGRKDAEQTVGISKLPPVSVTRNWADWGYWGFAGLLVVVGFFQVLLLGRQASIMAQQSILSEETLGAIKRQADIMERQTTATETAAQAAAIAAQTAAKQLELAHRPWVAGEIQAVTPLVFDADGMHLTLRLMLRNVGNSPAIKTVVTSNIASGWDESEIMPYMQSVSDKLKDGFLVETMGFTVFPGDKEIWSEMKIELTPEAVANSLDPQSHEFIMAAVLVVVDYQFSFTSGHHQTRYIFDLKRNNPVAPHLPLMIRPSDGFIAAEMLTLTYHIPRGSEAD
jgi:hypothetical protein